MGLGVALQEVAGDGVDLHGQLARGRYHQRARAIARHELGAVHQLDAGHQERQRLPRACMAQGTAHQQRSPLHTAEQQSAASSWACAITLPKQIPAEMAADIGTVQAEHN